MKITFTEVCIFSMIITTAHTLRCITCQASNAGCAKYAYECDSPEHVCMSLDTFIYEDGKTVTTFLKRGCGYPDLCGKYESFTATFYVAIASIRCCITNECNPPPVNMTRTVDKTKNGVICPTCFSENDELCDPKISMECTGDENQCVYYDKNAFFLSEQSTHVKGCGTENICRNNGVLLKAPFSYSQIACTIEKSNTSLPVENFIWCAFCHKDNAEMCTSNQLQCQPHYDVCVTERIRKKYDGRESTEVIRRCGTSNECNRDGTIRSASKLIVINTTCCDTNFCTPPTPILPPVSKNRNGLTCPACFVPNSDRCLGRDDLHCTGEENRCVQYVRKEVRAVSSVTETLFGCSNDNICEAGSYRMNLTGNYWQDIKTNIMCNRANISNKLDLILPGSVLIILGVIKLF